MENISENIRDISVQVKQRKL